MGKVLYEHFTGRAKDAGAQRIKAITTVGNEGSIRFHQALGFAMHEDTDYAGTGRSRVVFTKDL